MTGERKRTINLFCPSLSKATPFAACDEQKLDLGSISRAFGLDPATLKLNGHFIGRGVDLVASSVTWRSLLSFFSSRGLPTGDSDSGAVVVDGKLSRIGTKRAPEQADVGNGIWHVIDRPSSSTYTRPQVEDTKFLKSKKLKESSSGDIDSDDKIARGDGFGLKRKQLLEDAIPCKRIKMARTNPGSDSGENGIPRVDSNTQLRCSSTGNNMKRTREDDILYILLDSSENLAPAITVRVRGYRFLQLEVLYVAAGSSICRVIVNEVTF